MKIYLITFFVVVFFQSVNGQKITRRINWDEHSVDEFLGSLDRFSGAYVTEGGLPVYQEILSLDGANKRISITNLMFADMNTTSEKSYSGIKEELTISPRYIHSKGKYQALLNFVPIRYHNQHYQKLISFDVENSSSQEKFAVQEAQVWKNSSVLASGHWVKIKTDNQGIYKITYDQLQSWGFSNPSAVCLFGNGGHMLPKMNDDFYFDDLHQNAIYHGKDGQGKDCIFFYSTGTVRWNLNSTTEKFTQELNDYSDFSYYFLSDQGEEKLVEEMPEETGSPTKQVSAFNEHVFHELELENLIKSGRHWYGEKFLNGQNKSFSIQLDAPESGQPIKVAIEGAGRSSSSSSLNVSINNSSVDALGFIRVQTDESTATYADIESKNYELTESSSELNFKFTYLASNSSSLAWLDFVTVNYMRKLSVDDQLMFRDVTNIGEGNITQFKITASGANFLIWDVTDFTNPTSVPYSKDGNLASFNATADLLHEYAGFYTDANLPQPEFVGEVDNQNLHQMADADMVIISHPDFLSEANDLAQFHREHDQLSVEIVTPSTIYNEFSGGNPDVAGIRNFLKMLYDRNGSPLKYVLLFGDGSYDNKNISGTANNFILTYQSPNSLLPTSSFVTDDFYALLDAGEGEYTGQIDLGIGRIPAKTTTEAKVVVDKVKNYANSNSLGDWRNVICFIGDDENNNIHMIQADDLSKVVNESSPSFYTDKIYFDAYVQKSTSAGQRYPGVTDAINKRVKEGALILNYTGHANETAISDEKVLGTSDIDSWSNYNKLPIFVTATCEFSRFDDQENSGGEHILFNPNGGGIGLFSTTRLVWSNPNYILNDEFYHHVFSQDEDGNNLRMGEVMKRSKNGISTGINKRNFTLLADPALSLGFSEI